MLQTYLVKNLCFYFFLAKKVRGKALFQENLPISFLFVCLFVCLQVRIFFFIQIFRTISKLSKNLMFGFLPISKYRLYVRYAETCDNGSNVYYLQFSIKTVLNPISPKIVNNPPSLFCDFCFSDLFLTCLDEENPFYVKRITKHCGGSGAYSPNCLNFLSLQAHNETFKATEE